MKILFTFLLTTFAFISQAQENLEKEYLIALIHLKSNEALNAQLNDFFNQSVNSQNQFIEFKTVSKIDFFEIQNIDSLINLNLDLNTKELLNNYNEYRFKLFRNHLVKKLVPNPDAQFKLTFSKPMQNHLLAELRPIKKKFKKKVQLLFIFDENGLVRNVLTLY